MPANLPEPLVPTEVDLTDFPTMPLDVRMLRDSKFASEASAEAYRAGTMLWCAAWHQVPAGSLPDNDRELSNLAGYGRVVAEWLKVKAEALALFTKCSDGRLYHREVCKQALVSWERKLRFAWQKEVDRIYKENKGRRERQEPAVKPPTFEQWNADRIAKLAAGVPAETRAVPAETPAAAVGLPAISGGLRPERQPESPAPSVGAATGNPPENSLKGEERRGEETYLLPTVGARDPKSAETSGETRTSPQAAVCIALRHVGMARVNPAHPTLLALVDAGATVDEFLGAAPRAMQAEGDPFAYLLAMVEGQRRDAAKKANGLHRGPLPQAPQETPAQRAKRERYAEMTGGLASRPDPTQSPATVTENVDARPPALGLA